MMKILQRSALAWMFLAAWTISNASGADLAADKQQEIDALNESVSEAARLFKQGKFKDCADVVRRTQQTYETMATGGGPDVAAALQPVYERLSKAHALLELEGVSLPPLKKMDAAGSIPDSSGTSAASFASDVAPLLVEKCLNCHGRGRRPGGRLNLINFAGLTRGGERGPALVAGKPADSLLVQKLKGTADGERMPLNQPPLADGEIAKIEAWIAAGAKFDGSAETRDLAQVARMANAQQATPDELAAAREEAALKNWALGMPGIEAARAQTEHFLLLGNVSEQTLQQNGELAESLFPKVGELFAAPADAPLVKGRITLFLLDKRYDYTEFGTMVEKRAPPAEWTGHWTYNVADAYGVSIVPKAGGQSMDALLVQQLAGLYVASLGSAPRWFAEGVARAAAAKLQPDDARVKAWDTQLPAAVASLKRPDDFQTGNASPEYGDLASYSFAKLLMTDARRFRTLLQGIRASQDFAAACTAAYGGSPSQVAEIWYKRASAAKTR